MRVGLIAGEASGDILGAGLIHSLKAAHPEISFEGIAGPLMQEAGCKAIFPSDKLAVMGLVEVLAHYRELSAIRKQIIRHFIDNPPDVFIGIDAPDFNLEVERQLKNAGIKTVHYVSPSVWAWRQYRLKRINESVNLMLTLFPFEARFYEEHNVDVKFVGHTLADEIPFDVDPLAELEKLEKFSGNALKKPLVALLPGSRYSEVSRLAKPFIETALWVHRHQPDVQFVVPLVNQKTQQAFDAVLSNYANTDCIHVVEGHSRLVMSAADAVLLASGTASLEAMLLKKPMTVAYKLSPITYQIAKRLLKVPYYSLPNLLAGERLVDEVTQNDVNAEVLGPKVLAMLDPEEWQDRLKVFDDIHHSLCCGANDTAARAVLDLVQARV